MLQKRVLGHESSSDRLGSPISGGVSGAEQWSKSIGGSGSDAVDDTGALVVVHAFVRGYHESVVLSVPLNSLLHTASSTGAPVVISAHSCTIVRH